VPRHGVMAGPMKPSSNESSDGSEDKVVVDPAELERASVASATMVRGEGAALVRAKGTREQLTLPPRPAELVAPARAPRDPAEVLRAWPHSMIGRDARTTALRPASPVRPMAAARPRVEDKVTLAHLALDLYREVEQIEAGSRRASSEPDAGLCTNRGCDVRINALRGALIEACLLVQRAVLMTPSAAASAEIEDRIHQLLDLLED
jgi:hypothetical protein